MLESKLTQVLAPRIAKVAFYYTVTYFKVAQKVSKYLATLIKIITDKNF